MESVIRLGPQFPDKIMRDMTVVTYGYMLVSAFHPALINAIHHMAVPTGFGVIRHIGIPLGINEGKDSNPRKQPRKAKRRHPWKKEFSPEVSTEIGLNKFPEHCAKSPLK